MVRRYFHIHLIRIYVIHLQFNHWYCVLCATALISLLWFSVLIPTCLVVMAMFQCYLRSILTTSLVLPKTGRHGSKSRSSKSNRSSSHRHRQHTSNSNSTHNVSLSGPPILGDEISSAKPSTSSSNTAITTAPLSAPGGFQRFLLLVIALGMVAIIGMIYTLVSMLESGIVFVLSTNIVQRLATH